MRTLVPTEDQQHIAEAARELLQGLWPLDRLREWALHGDMSRWQSLADLGAFGIGLGEADGGLGLSCVEETLVLRECGRALVPPRVAATVLAAHLAVVSGDAALRDRLLAGEQAVGLLHAAGPHTTGPRLHGRWQALDAEGCDWLLAWSGAGCALVERAALPLRAGRCIDETLSIESLDIPEEQAVAARTWVPAETAPLPQRLDLLIAALLAGAAEAARDMAADYARLREAFGQPIGAFQGVKHACADTAVRAEAAWCQTLVAAIGLRDAPGTVEVAADLAAARWLAGDAAQTNAETNVQIHGGIGFSAEALPHRFVKRAVALRALGLMGRDLRGDLLNAPAAGDGKGRTFAIHDNTQETTT
ncbi:acyl-CoA dehydrogenase family protein [Hydrogenophaga sp. BPS33]|uniref:acyl-CoA dehydrogenase family protein n=1 Tax=Hydrogenophaga sp. BPS33 TaxID=2651974 RepID=UPI00131FAF58|nr:acyl-CoA dehydrogenase family protein [Hydrogenophaga sp. BPS33]QHE83689.1 acyl-CoA dehydrogenase [Hydrogenophaga sp. BPS33]